MLSVLPDQGVAPSENGRSETCHFPSEQTERDFNLSLDGDWLAVLHARFESPLLHGFDGLFVQTQAQRPDHVDIDRLAVFIHNQGKQHCALPLLLAGFLGVLRLRMVDGNRVGYAAAGTIDAAAHAAARSVSDSITFAVSNSAAGAIAEAAAVSAARHGRQSSLRADGRRIDIG